MKRTILALVVLLSGCGRDIEDDIGRLSMPVIVGEDDRVDWYEADEPWRTRAAESIAAVVLSERVHVDDDGSVTLSSMTLPDLVTGGTLCDDVRFLDQPTLAHCSATLVDDDVILTASHCLTAPDCSGISFVFDYRYRAEGELETVDASDVYECREVIATENETYGDFAFLRLDRPVDAERAPLELALEPPADGSPLHMLGFPLGLPLKVTGGEVVVVEGEGWRPLIDSFGGNSGASLVDDEGKVRGILLGTDGSYESFENAGDCYREARYEEDREHVPAYGTSAEYLAAAYCAAVDCDSPGSDAGTAEADAGTVEADASTADADGGVPTTDDAGMEPAPAASGGCHAAPSAPSSSPLLVLATLGLALAWRRRREASRRQCKRYDAVP